MNFRISNIFLLITMLYLVIPAHAGDNDHDRARQLSERGDILALEVILQRLREIQPGKVIEVELEKEHGQYVYEIEVLTPEGKILELLFDAKTGTHLSTEKEE